MSNSLTTDNDEDENMKVVLRLEDSKQGVDLESKGNILTHSTISYTMAVKMCS